MTCLVDIKDFDDAFFKKAEEVVSKIFTGERENKNRTSSLCGRLLLGYMLKKEFNLDNFSFHYGEKDKPYLANNDIFFNISHSGTLVICSTDRREIGCDVQIIKDYNPKVAQRFFSEKEVSLIEKAEDKNKAFIKLWALKESILKKHGTGISGGLSSFDFSDFFAVDDFFAFDCRFSCFSLEGYEIAVCGENTKHELRTISREELEKYIDNIKL